MLIDTLNHCILYSSPLGKMFGQQVDDKEVELDTRPTIDTLKILVQIVRIDRQGILTKYIKDNVCFWKVIRDAMVSAVSSQQSEGATDGDDDEEMGED